MELSFTTRQLFALIRAGIGHKAPDFSLFPQNTDWVTLFNLAQIHGLIGICFEGMVNLRKSFKDDKDDATIIALMQIIGYANVIKKQYNEYLQIAFDLANNLKEQKLEFLILKGLSLAPYYPIPEERCFGDLDIYSFGDQDKVNEIICKSGIEIEYGSKHDVFVYRGITVEQHRTFVGLINDSTRKLNDFLIAEANKEKCTQTAAGWYIPNHRFNAIFLLRHMSKHYFGEGISLRQILDWALFILATNMEELSVRQILEESRMVTAWNTFTAVAGIVIGADFSSFYIGSPNMVLVYRVLADVINYHPVEIRKAGLIHRVVLKSNRLFATKWMFDNGLLPDNFWKDVVWRSICDHIKKPRFI